MTATTDPKGQRGRIRAVWAKVPDVGCKGLCAESCGPIGASRLEVRLLQRRGVRLEDVTTVVMRWVRLMEGEDPEVRPAGELVEDCPALVDGRCSVYDVRPTICRLWGAVENMPCPWGCVPEGGHLDTEEGFAILNESLGIGGR